MFTSLAQQRGERTLILAHRDELIGQAAKAVKQWWPGANIGRVKAELNEVDAQVVVASVQTLSRDNRLQQMVDTWNGNSLSWQPPFDLVVVDEAHHCVRGGGYDKILKALDAGKPDGPLLVGVTATPDRADGQGLDGIFDEIVWSYDMLWGIRAGYLCDVRGLRIKVENLDLSTVKVSAGDYQAGDAGRAMTEANGPAVIVKAWLEHASERRTVVFTPTVATAQEVSDEFRDAGVKAAWISGDTPIEERRDILDDYEHDRIQVLANCAVLLEGWDSPGTSCVVMARPTKSRALFAQAVGRGTRLHPGKADLLVLDVTGVSDDLSLMTVPSLMGVDDKFRKKMERGEATVTDVLDEQDDWLLEQGRITAEEANLFREIRAQTSLAWVPIHEPGTQGLWVRSLGEDQATTRAKTLVLQEHDDDQYTLWTHTTQPKKPRKGETAQRASIAVAVSLDEAQARAEDYCRRHGSALSRQDAAWRAKKPSARAIEFAARLDIAVEDGWRAGDLSDAIDGVMARRRVKRLDRGTLDKLIEREAAKAMVSVK